MRILFWNTHLCGLPDLHLLYNGGFLLVLRLSPLASASLPSSAGGFISVSLIWMYCSVSITSVAPRQTTVIVFVPAPRCFIPLSRPMIPPRSVDTITRMNIFRKLHAAKFPRIMSTSLLTYAHGQNRFSGSPVPGDSLHTK